MPTLRKPIVVVGSINMDLVARADRIPVVGETIAGSTFDTHAGGKGANQAVAVAQLGYPVALIGKVGSDGFGTQLRQSLAQAGVDLSGVATVDGTSGVAVIVVSSRGENSIVVVPGANALLTPDDIDQQLERIRSAGIVLAQLEIPLATVERLAEICMREGVPLVLDPAPARTLSATLLSRISWLTPNETEAQFYVAQANADGAAHDQTIAALLALGPEGVVLKLGEQGARVGSKGQVPTLVAPFTVRATDTTAAGDAFNGAFATGLMLGKGVVESTRFANAAAAFSVTRHGAQPSMPSLADVEALLAERAVRYDGVSAEQ